VSRSANPDHASPDGIRAARARRRRPLPRRQLVWGLVRAGTFLAAAAALLLLAGDGARPPVDVVVVLVLAYSLAWRLELETTASVTVPSGLALVPMFVLLPPGWVPIAAAAGGILADLASDQRARRMLGTLACAWSAVPACVLLAVVQPEPVWSQAWVYAAAVAAWVVADALTSFLHLRVVLVRRESTLRSVAEMYRPEAPLAILAFLGAMESDRFRYAFLLPFAAMAIFRQLAQERRRRVEQAEELSRAYRGTAMLLGAVVDADDGYTGWHSRNVVDTVLGVAEELGLDEAERRRAEFAALLHDIGKIQIPNEIINKPGPLTDEEWTIVRRHPAEGAKMLAGVGGYLADVGLLVRHHHERWDGGGYPDGLAADAIPLVSRIIAACDAFSSMTSDRSYRRALPLATALAELRANAGTQFDPAVVAALVRVAERAAFAERAADGASVPRGQAA
jgi:HD-GYP domain-containing protein (c-di-GMP phosphodiesterase class II)